MTAALQLGGMFFHATTQIFLDGGAHNLEILSISLGSKRMAICQAKVSLPVGKAQVIP